MTDVMCKDCKFYDLETVQDKAGKIRKARSAQCLWKTPPLPAAADYYGGVHCGYMPPSVPARCDTFSPRGHVDPPVLVYIKRVKADAVLVKRNGYPEMVLDLCVGDDITFEESARSVRIVKK